MENEEKNKDSKKVSTTAFWLPIGMCLGCSLGIALDNLAMGISLGMLFGLAIGNAFDHQSKDKSDADPTEEKKD